MKIIKVHNAKINVENIGDNLEDMQNVVGGYIEALPVPNERNFKLYVNEEGKLMNLPNNFVFCGIMIKGDAFFARNNDEGEMVDVTQDDIDLIGGIYG